MHAAAASPTCSLLARAVMEKAPVRSCTVYTIHWGDVAALVRRFRPRSAMPSRPSTASCATTSASLRRSMVLRLRRWHGAAAAATIKQWQHHEHFCWVCACAWLCQVWVHACSFIDLSSLLPLRTPLTMAAAHRLLRGTFEPQQLTASSIFDGELDTQVGALTCTCSKLQCAISVCTFCLLS